MPTVSTKQRARKKARANVAQTPAAKPTGLTVTPERKNVPEISERTWRGASIAVLLVAAFWRLYALDLKPLHHDEGVNGFFLLRLLRDGIYHYDPANYHGPTLYYFVLPFVALHNSTVAVRLVPALFGLATVGLALCLRKHIGALGSLTAAGLIALSPGAVYISRYFIHEALFVFFTLGIVVAVLRYYDSKQTPYLMLASASAALLFATKETAFISLGVLTLATILAWGYVRFRRGRGWSPAGSASRNVRGAKTAQGTSVGTQVSESVAGFGSRRRVLMLFLAAFALFIFINVLFYSSFFTYAEGVKGALKTFEIWARTGGKEHAKPLDTYIRWLLRVESPLLILGTVGAALAVWRGTERFAIFAGAWAFGTLAAYSLIPYKTPWLMLNITIPLAIIGGYALNVLYWRGHRTPFWRTVSLGLAGLAVAICTYQTYQLNFVHYDDDSYIYAYAHTRREFVQMVNEIERIAERAGTGKETSIGIASPDYWPIPWYLRNYKHVGYLGKVGATKDAIVITSETQESQAQSLLGSNYQRINSYALRPGVNLVLYVRRDLMAP